MMGNLTCLFSLLKTSEDLRQNKMEMFQFFNSSLLLSHRPLNSSSREETLYASCSHIPAVIIFYLVLQIINMFLGIPANIMVLWLICKNKGDSSTSDIFIFHLAMLDTFFCLVPPLELVNILFLTDTSISWYVLLFFYGVKDSSPLFLSCICLDRYVAVLHPITFAKLKDKSHRSVCAGIVWIFIVCYSAAKSLKIKSFEKVFTVMILVVFVFMVFCNVSILWALRRSAPGRDERHPVKKKAFKMVIIILAIIVFNYFPPVALFPFQSYFSQEVFRCYIHYVAFGFMDISSSIQPVLYLSREKLPKEVSCCGTTAELSDIEVFTVAQ